MILNWSGVRAWKVKEGQTFRKGGQKRFSHQLEESFRGGGGCGGNLIERGKNSA